MWEWVLLVGFFIISRQLQPSAVLYHSPNCTELRSQHGRYIDFSRCRFWRSTSWEKGKARRSSRRGSGIFETKVGRLLHGRYLADLESSTMTLIHALALLQRGWRALSSCWRTEALSDHRWRCAAHFFQPNRFPVLGDGSIQMYEKFYAELVSSASMFTSILQGLKCPVVMKTVLNYYMLASSHDLLTMIILEAGVYRFTAWLIWTEKTTVNTEGCS